MAFILLFTACGPMPGASGPAGPPGAPGAPRKESSERKYLKGGRVS